MQKETTPDRKLEGYDIDLEPFEAACRTIAERCKQNVLAIVETTVPPGTCRDVVNPIFNEEFEKRGLPKNYRLGHSFWKMISEPDYVDSNCNFYCVCAGIEEESADATRDFLETIIYTDEYSLTRLGSTTASEPTKVLENPYRAMNIAFVQEQTALCGEMSVNLCEVTEAIRNCLMHQNLLPLERGVRGDCLTKDPPLVSWARSSHGNGEHHLPCIEKSVKINDCMPEHTTEQVEEELQGEVSEKKIALLGV